MEELRCEHCQVHYGYPQMDEWAYCPRCASRLRRSGAAKEPPLPPGAVIQAELDYQVDRIIRMIQKDRAEIREIDRKLMAVRAALRNDE